MINKISTSLLTLCLGAQSALALNVIIDPGHGGEDHGATYFGLHESKINLQIAKRLDELLNSDSRFKGFLTRHDDSFLGLKDRASYASEKNGDLFLSLHTNAFNRPNAKGVEFYFQNQLPPEEEAMFLANQENNIAKHDSQLLWPISPIADADRVAPEVLSIIQDLQLNFRIRRSGLLTEYLHQNWLGQFLSQEHSIRQAPFYVVSNVAMPSALIEMGYLSNVNEANMLKSGSYQQKIAESLYNGIVKYKEFVDKSNK